MPSQPRFIHFIYDISFALLITDKMDTEAQQPVQEQQSGQKKSFKVVGHLVMAMKRLQGEQRVQLSEADCWGSI